MIEGSKDPRPMTPTPTDGVACRESSAAVLRNEAEGLRRKAHALDALAYQIEHMEGEVEQALWSILMEVRHR